MINSVLFKEPHKYVKKINFQPNFFKKYQYSLKTLTNHKIVINKHHSEEIII